MNVAGIEGDLSVLRQRMSFDWSCLILSRCQVEQDGSLLLWSLIQQGGDSLSFRSCPCIRPEESNLSCRRRRTRRWKRAVCRMAIRRWKQDADGLARRFLAQARSDCEMLQLLSSQTRPFLSTNCIICRWQRRNLAKGFPRRPAGLASAKCIALCRLAASQSTTGNCRRACHLRPLGQIDAYIASLLPLARLIEDLAPANANAGPNPEYPWHEPSGVIAPVAGRSAQSAVQERSMVNMLSFLERCFQII